MNEEMTEQQVEAARINGQMQEQGISLEERVWALEEAVLKLLEFTQIIAIKFEDIRKRSMIDTEAS